MRAGDHVREDGGPVSPEGGVMGVDGAGEEADEAEEQEETLQLEEDVERHAGIVDKRLVRKMVDPRKPTAEEVKEHDLTHIPYRNWCPICVRCKGKDLDHRKSAEEDRGVSEYAFDYCFPGDEFGFKLVVLAGREKATGMYFATAVPTKGSIGRFAVDKVIDYMDELGDRNGRVIVKTDQEPAIKTFVKDLVEAREEGRTITEESPVKSSGSNGRAERAVQTLEGHIRVLLLGLEARLGTRIDAKEPIVTYMPEYAAYLLNRMKVGKDGRTAYERCKGKKATILGLEFGEKLLYKVKEDAKQAKIRSRWEHGIFVGVRPRSGEVWVATTEKTFSVRSVRRLPADQRWGVDCVRWPRRTLWNRYKDDSGADGELPEEVPQAVAPDVGPRGGVIFMETRDKVPRDFYIKKSDAEKHGYTRGCAGCSSWFRGLGRQPHTEACRERFRKLMQDEAKVQLAKSRRQEFEESQLEKKRKKEDRKEEKAQRKRKAEEEADDRERCEREDRSEEGAQKRKAEEEPDDEERASREEMADKKDDSPWKDFCVVERGEIIDEEDARTWVCEVQQELGQEACVGQRALSPAEHMEEFDPAGDEDLGGELDPEKVAEARREEVAYMKTRGLWNVIPRPEGVTPVSVRWVDVLKTEGITRSRLVARDFRGGDRHRDDLFAATPPLEAIRVLISRAATETPSRRRRKMMFVDAKKAHLNPKCEEDVYIELPEEAGEDKGMCGKLVYWLYGFRKAASEWEKFYAARLEECGFKRGTGCPVLFHHKERDLSAAVHGDDFVFTGYDEDLKWAADYIKGCFEVKVRAVLGAGSDDDKEVTVLGRTVRWRPWGIEYEADAKHRRLLLAQFGLEGGAKSLEGNGEADPGEVGDNGDDDELDSSEATQYRAAVARMNFLGQDSPDLQFPAKELSKDMSRPTVGSWKRLKKAVRFLVGRRRVVWNFPWQEEVGVVQVFADSDWGGCKRSRKSTSGGAVMLGQHCVRTWSSTQAAIALSSAEAEFYALVDATLRAKGMLSVLSELGLPSVGQAVEVFTDSSAAKSFVSKRGLGKMRHLELRDLWLQREVGEGKVVVRKIAGARNPADAMTKFLSRIDLQTRLNSLGLEMEWRASNGGTARGRGGV